MKKRLMVILFALVLGGGVAYFMFSREYVSDVVKVKVKAFQVGVFTNYDNALKVADRNNGIVVRDDDLYRVYVSILSSEEAVDKMKKYYDSIGLHYYLRDIEVNSEFLINVRNTEELLFRSDVDAYNIINLSVLSEFEELL
jgi:hypothetical protein